MRNPLSGTKCSFFEYSTPPLILTHIDCPCRSGNTWDTRETQCEKQYWKEFNIRGHSPTMCDAACRCLWATVKIGTPFHLNSPPLGESDGFTLTSTWSSSFWCSWILNDGVTVTRWDLSAFQPPSVSLFIHQRAVEQKCVSQALAWASAEQHCFLIFRLFSIATSDVVLFPSIQWTFVEKCHFGCPTFLLLEPHLSGVEKFPLLSTPW